MGNSPSVVHSAAIKALENCLQAQAKHYEDRDKAREAADKAMNDAAKEREETFAAANKKVEEAVRVREEAAREREEAALLSAKATKEAARQRAEAALLKAKQTEEAALKREEAAVLAAKEQNEAARQREEAALLAAKKIEASAREREEAARAELSKAQEALLRGIRPVILPTPDQIDAAKKRIEYDPSKLHLAVCGSSGSGKSSVINAVRGLRSKADRAAGVGVTECTSQITRYPDLRKELPYSMFVWFDIPGAGTTDVPDWQYFNDQGLFVFDFIIMVYDVRFTKIDVGIIENCFRFHIPVFIVRSKADQHILNMIQSEIDCDPQDSEYPEVYRKFCTRYVKETRDNFDKHIEHMASNEELDERDRQLLNSQRVYIISESKLRSYVLNPDQNNNVIDEVNLVEDMLLVAGRMKNPRSIGGRSSTRTRKEASCATVSAMNLGTGSEKKQSVDATPAGGGVVVPGASLAGASTPLTAIPHPPQ